MEYLAIISGVFLVSVLLYLNYRFVSFSPKADALCILWKRIEHPEEHVVKENAFFEAITLPSR